MVGDRKNIGLRGGGVAGPGEIIFPVFKLLRKGGGASDRRII